MAYVYYVPSAPLPTVQERPSLCSPSRTNGFICGPILIFLGGATSLMIGFFERKPAIIWPIVSFGAVMCAAGVYMARRHVKQWREAEQERQRAMWRSNRSQPGGPRRSGGDGGDEQPEYDVPMYCLEAPSLPLVRPSGERMARSSQQGTSSGGSGGDGQQYGGEFWCALAVPLAPDDVTNGEYLNWAAMTLVVQPHFKFGAQAQALAAAGGGGCSGGGGAAAAAGVSPGVLTRAMGRATTFSGFGQLRDGNGYGEGGTELASEPTLAAVSLTLVRSPSLGSRSGHGSFHSGGGGGGGERRVGRGSRTGRLGDLLSLFAAMAGNAGGGGDDGAGGGGAAAAPPEVDENGVELAGIKAMAAQAAAAAAAGQRPTPPAAAAATPPPLPATAVAAAGPSGHETADVQQCSGPNGEEAAVGLPSEAAGAVVAPPAAPSSPRNAS
ncbi:hypothetical protein PLESTM_000150900 [Pleodorina starrii]|nr:hypothetical protein PLESTM_000150900 [Pleodorina starrii]